MTIEQIRAIETTPGQTRGVKVRIVQTMKVTGEKNTDLMAQTKALSAKDLADFAGWFNDIGLPTTFTPSEG